MKAHPKQSKIGLQRNFGIPTPTMCSDFPDQAEHRAHPLPLPAEPALHTEPHTHTGLFSYMRACPCPRGGSLSSVRGEASTRGAGDRAGSQFPALQTAGSSANLRSTWAKHRRYFSLAGEAVRVHLSSRRPPSTARVRQRILKGPNKASAAGQTEALNTRKRGLWFQSVVCIILPTRQD